MTRALLLALALLLAGCAGTVPQPRERAGVVPLPGQTFPSAGQLMGRSAGQLTGLFGKPELDVTEGPGRKLQFASPGCVLDAYLYPRGGGEPVVTYVDARQPDGTPADRGACINALGKRPRR
jgi:hypothetical protein